MFNNNEIKVIYTATEDKTFLVQEVKRPDGLIQDIWLTEENEIIMGDVYLPF